MDNIIEVKNFSKSFGKLKAVDDLSFEVKKGEIFAFLGSNGSGKTTTIRCLLKIYEADCGTLHINGQPYDQSQSRILGYIPEERGLSLSSKVLETLVYFGALKGLDESTARTRAANYLKRVGLLSKSDIDIKNLSSGQQQKIQLGIAVINTPSLLILDEPTRGLDPVNRSLLMEILDELNQKGTTIIYTTHQMEDVERLANRLLMIKNGKRQLYGPLEEVKKQFGTDTIRIDYTGKFPKNEKLYTATSTTHHAEIKPHKGVPPDDVLKYLLTTDLKIQKFEVGSPSLEDIFITVSKMDK